MLLNYSKLLNQKHTSHLLAVQKSDLNFTTFVQFNSRECLQIFYLSKLVHKGIVYLKVQEFNNFKDLYPTQNCSSFYMHTRVLGWGSRMFLRWTIQLEQQIKKDSVLQDFKQHPLRKKPISNTQTRKYRFINRFEENTWQKSIACSTYIFLVSSFKLIFSLSGQNMPTMKYSLNHSITKPENL